MAAPYGGRHFRNSHLFGVGRQIEFLRNASLNAAQVDWLVFGVLQLATSQVIKEHVTVRTYCLPWHTSAAPLGEQATSTMTWYPTQSHYPNTKPTNPCHILIMSITWLGSDNYHLLSHWSDSTRVRTHEVQITRSPKMGNKLNSFGHTVWSPQFERPDHSDHKDI